MNSDYDFTLDSSESASSGEARNRFLDSLGVGENALRSLDKNQSETSQDDEGLVLSSQPELEESETSVELSKGRAISISVNRGAVVNRSLEISVPAAPKSDANDGADTAPPLEPSADDLETVLSLNCPECSGDLVIKRRHLGVEGACVWCHTPIVAAETARDRQIRVFPLLGGIQRAVSESAPLPESRIESAPEISAAPWKALEAAVEPEFPSTPEPESSTLELPETEVAESPVDELYGANFGFSTAFEPSAGGKDGGETFAEVSRADPAEAPVPMDLEDLYATTGFGSPAEENTPSPGFGETLANPPKGSAAFNPAGFGAFLQSPATAPAGGRGSDSPPASFSGANVDAATTISEPAAQTQAGFASPAPWGPPTKFVPDEPVIDAPPALIPENSSAANWSSGFRNQEEPGKAPSLVDNEPVAETSPPSTGFEGFGTAFGTPLPELEKFESAEFPAAASSGFSFNDSPAGNLLFGKGEASSDSFAVPGHCFSTGSSSASGPEHSDAVFPSNSGEGPDSPVFEASETGLPEADDPAPEFTRGDSPFPSINQGTSLFGDSPFVSFQNETASTPYFTGSAISERQPAPESPAPGADAPLTPSTHHPVVQTGPVITSLPLGRKPKPKVRKGFIVLMVIIVGFASGAALASFVLPVEQYVQTARAYMEKKFNPSEAIQPALPISSASGAGLPVDTAEP